MRLFEFQDQLDNAPKYYQVDINIDSTFDLKVFDKNKDLLHRYSKHRVSGSRIDDIVSELEHNYIGITEISEFSESLPGHMGMDLAKDTVVNDKEINALLATYNGDVEQVLYQLSKTNTTWQMIIDHYGIEEAKRMILKSIG